MTGKTSHKLNIIISTALLALFLYLAFRNVNLNELIDILKNTNYLYVILGVGFGVIGGTYVRTLRWRVLLEPVRTGMTMRNLFGSTAVGYMVNNLIPRSGEIVRPYLLGKREGISKSAAFGTIILERIIDTLTFLIMFAVILFFFKSKITNAIPQIDFAIIALGSLTILLIVWVLFMLFKAETSLKMIRFFTHILPERFEAKIIKFFHSITDGFQSIRKPSLIIKIVGYTAVIWFVYLCSTIIPFYSFGIFSDAGHFSEILWSGNLLLVLINVAMFIPSPAATGPYHYVCKATLVTIFSVQETKALGYATSTHLMSFIFYLIIGLYFFISSNYKLSELREETAKV